MKEADPLRRFVSHIAGGRRWFAVYGAYVVGLSVDSLEYSAGSEASRFPPLPQPLPSGTALSPVRGVSLDAELLAMILEDLAVAKDHAIGNHGLQP